MIPVIVPMPIYTDVVLNAELSLLYSILVMSFCIWAFIKIHNFDPLKK